MPKANKMIIALFSTIIAFSLFSMFTNLYVDFLWFKSEGFAQVFKSILLWSWGLRLVVATISFLFIYVNLLVAKKALINSPFFRQEDENVIHLYNREWLKLISPKLLNIGLIILSAAVALLLSSAVSGQWEVVQKFLNSTSFSIVDPIFSKDIGFFVFQLPFFKFIYGILFSNLIISIMIVGFVYFIAHPQDLLSKHSFDYKKVHLLTLVALFFVLNAVNYFFNQYELLYSTQGTIYGVGFTDINANLIALKILPLISIICAGIVIVGIIKRRQNFAWGSLGLFLVSVIILNGIFPSVVQKFWVEPDELNKETPFIKNHIEFTRKAYNLDKIKKQQFPSEQELTLQDLEENPETIANIRLWDVEPLKQTFGQLQEMRQYYQFNDVDVDRYRVNGEYRQVMLSARELTTEQLQVQAKTWINQKLTYTHGYGVTMTPVNEVSNEGLPLFFIKNIPPESTVDVVVDRPEIYFGELTNDYVVANTKAKEFDYPKGDENVYSFYEGKGGIKLKSFFDKLIFAFNFKEIKLLLNNDIKPESKILMERNIINRVQKVAPFINFDNDPYITVVNGQLLWIIDGYTSSDRYPYSEPYGTMGNYIRNSVKAVINAYDGQMSFYISEPNDPIIKTYSKIFPNLFLTWDEMSSELKEHMRYPEDLFAIQSEIYSSYHMENPQIFYNREDRWNIPEEMFAGEKKTMEPYYNIMKLPGEDKSEFILMRPFTAATKPNMVAWMAAKSDGKNYGTLLVYQFPKQKLIYGPMQIESRIDQDSEISQQLTLWSQRGSQVIRGNLLVIPIEDSLLYVEPIYLQAEQSKLPELRRVVVAYGENIVMEQNLKLALEKIFGKSTEQKQGQDASEPNDIKGEPKDTPRGDQASGSGDVNELINKANELFGISQQKVEQGDWSGYGKTLEELEKTLEKLNQLTE